MVAYNPCSAASDAKPLSLIHYFTVVCGQLRASFKFAVTDG